MRKFIPDFFIDVWSSRLFRILFFIAGLSHFIGVLVPETGFDAVWYHLPITQVFLNRGWDGFIPELYQSAMPHLGSLIFVLPYVVFGVVGIKLFTYILVWLMIVLMYRIAKPLIGIRYALFGCLIFFTFHTVGWQASSAYVDSVRTVFELATIRLIMEKKRVSPVFAGIFLGLALSTKLLAFLMLPAFFLFAMIRKHSRFARVMCITAILVVSPWFVRSYLWTGNPIYPLFQSSLGVDQVAHLGYGTVLSWLTHQVVMIPFLPVIMSIQWGDWTSPIFILGAFSAIYVKKEVWKKHLGLLAFVLIFMIFWLLFPPLSVRYALTGFSIAIMMCLLAFKNLPQKFYTLRQIFIVICWLGISFNLVYRFGANTKQLELLTGKISHQTYLDQRSQGVAKGPMEKWYSGYWARYGK